MCKMAISIVRCLMDYGIKPGSYNLSQLFDCIKVHPD